MASSASAQTTRSAALEPPPRRLLRRLGFILLIPLTLLAVGLLYLQHQLKPVAAQAVPSPITETLGGPVSSPQVSASTQLVAANPANLTEFEVEPGWGARRVAEALEAQGFIRNALVFSWFLRYKGIDRAIGEGLYDLSPDLDMADIAAILVAGGRPRSTNVVIPEGWRARDIAARLEQSGFGSSSDLVTLLSSTTPDSPAYIPAGAPLEGYLFPAGYDIPLDSTPEAIITRMLARFNEEITPEVSARLEELGLTVNDWVTLASIVQSEAASAEEMPIIAGVFLNRLEDGNLLQSDPTVAYGLGKDLPDLSAPAGDFEQDHPWNTYLTPGLPATPINNPGSAALHSVLEPVRRNADGKEYYYFLHGYDNGEPVFRPNITLDDHNRDVQRYLR